MEDPATRRLVDDYLARLDAAAWVLPPDRRVAIFQARSESGRSASVAAWIVVAVALAVLGLLVANAFYVRLT
jgi:predicted anti-sigma-YlaC factor YlaD